MGGWGTPDGSSMDSHSGLMWLSFCREWCFEVGVCFVGVCIVVLVVCLVVLCCVCHLCICFHTRVQ